jgi:hypothetical protein
MDSDKLLPAGKVYEMEMSTVFVTQDIARQTRKEGHRAILREVGNVRARFGERESEREVAVSTGGFR